MTARRGTSNADDRGNVHDRRRRRARLLASYAADQKMLRITRQDPDGAAETFDLPVEAKRHLPKEEAQMSTTISRAAIGYMTYPGDCVRSIDARIESGWPMGPNYLGEVMWPVTAEYEPDVARTRVGFSLIPPPAVADQMAQVEATRARAARRFKR